MTRVIVHAGFYKTGTTSLQKQLVRLRSKLTPYMAYYGDEDFAEVSALARQYAQRPFWYRRVMFRRAFRRFLSGIPDAPVIVMSRETLAGTMPGHRDWRARPITDYARSAVPVGREIIRELRRRFGSDVEIEFLLTTRETDKWLRSVYGHLLRSIHLTESYEDFLAQFPGLPSPTAEAYRIAKALRPCKTHIFALEDYAAHRHGPAGMVLDLVGLPEAVQDTLPAAVRKNIGQSAELEAKFLKLNRSGKSNAKLRIIKKRMMTDYRRKVKRGLSGNT
ncbi:MAG: sulfotransferase [Thalassovita sp.]|nr:sulfotransferase [Thalassovita sp.]